MPGRYRLTGSTGLAQGRLSKLGALSALSRAGATGASGSPWISLNACGAMQSRNIGWLVVLSAACASRAPAPAASPAASAVPAPVAESPNRALQRSECDSLAAWILDVCHDPTHHDGSVNAEGWCDDVARRNTQNDQSWIDDCIGHVKVIDDACFRSTTAVRNLMECDAQVSR